MAREIPEEQGPYQQEQEQEQDQVQRLSETDFEVISAMSHSLRAKGCCPCSFPPMHSSTRSLGWCAGAGGD